MRTGTALSPSSGGGWYLPGLETSGIDTRLINARAETVHTKPSFGGAFRSRRCLVPADGWFEWQRTGGRKQPYYLALAGGSPLSFAALWERWSRNGGSLESLSMVCVTRRRKVYIPWSRCRRDDGESNRWESMIAGDPTSPARQFVHLVCEPRAALLPNMEIVQLGGKYGP